MREFHKEYCRKNQVKNSFELGMGMSVLNSLVPGVRRGIKLFILSERHGNKGREGAVRGAKEDRAAEAAAASSTVVASDFITEVGVAVASELTLEVSPLSLVDNLRSNEID